MSIWSQKLISPFKSEFKNTGDNLGKRYNNNNPDDYYKNIDEIKKLGYDCEVKDNNGNGYCVYIDNNSDNYTDRSIFTDNKENVKSEYVDTDYDKNYDEYRVHNSDGSVTKYEYDYKNDTKKAKALENFTIRTDGRISDIKQGSIGDCWLLSGVKALSETTKGQKAIKNAIKTNKDGSYTVNFKGSGGKKYTITKNEIAQVKKSLEFSQGDDDMLLLEIAFCKYRKDTGNYESQDAKSILKSGDLGDVTEALLGKGPKRAFYMEDTVLAEYQKNPDKYAMQLVFSAEGADKTINDVNGNKVLLCPKNAAHGWSVEKVDDKTVTIVNPWDTSKKVTVNRQDLIDATHNITYYEF